MISLGVYKSGFQPSKMDSGWDIVDKFMAGTNYTQNKR
jgi:hypothetical protein